MKLTKTLLSVCAFGLSAAAVAAQPDFPAAPDEAGIIRNPPNSYDLDGAARAGEPFASDRNVDSYFSRYDTNRDGVISWDEAQQDDDLVRVFSQADANGDRVLSRDEFQQAAVLAVNESRQRSGG